MLQNCSATDLSTRTFDVLVSSISLLFLCLKFPRPESKIFHHPTSTATVDTTEKLQIYVRGVRADQEEV